jgi:hypothetical protein
MSFKDPGFGDRLASATSAKNAALAKFRAKPAADDPAVLKRQAEREAIEVAEQAAREVALEAERKAARDARYAARKARR